MDRIDRPTETELQKPKLKPINKVLMIIENIFDAVLRKLYDKDI